MKQIISLFILILICQLAVAQNWMTERYFKNGIPEAQTIADTLKYEMKLAQGSHAGNFVFQRTDNDSWDSLQSLRGKTALLSFWQSGCLPCVKELPDLAKIQTEFETAGLVLLLITPEDKARQEKFFAKNKLSIGGLKGTMPYSNYLPPFQCMINPTGYIVDSDGIIRDSWMGAQTYESLKNRLHEFLASKK